MHRRRLVLAITSVLLALALASRSAFAGPTYGGAVRPSRTGSVRPLDESQARVEFVPSNLQIEAGETALLDLMIYGAENLFAFDLRLGFNPAVIEIVDMDPLQGGTNVAPGDFIRADYVPINASDNVAGTISIVVTQVGGAPISGDGRLLSVTVRGKGEGQTTISFDDVSLIDDAVMEMAADTVAPFYVVLGSMTQESTPTPTPSATATPTTGGGASTATPTSTSTPDPSATPELYVDPAVLNLAPGQTGQVTIRTSHVTQLGGVDFYLQWDPTLLQVVDMDAGRAGTQIAPGDLFEGYQAMGANIVDDVAGILYYAHGILFNDPPVPDRAWSVAVVTFRALRVGSCMLEFTDWIMSTFEGGGLDIPSGATGGQVVVAVATETPTPTQTPTVTQTPVPTIPVSPTPGGRRPLYMPLALKNAR